MAVIMNPPTLPDLVCLKLFTFFVASSSVQLYNFAIYLSIFRKWQYLGANMTSLSYSGVKVLGQCFSKAGCFLSAALIASGVSSWAQAGEITVSAAASLSNAFKEIAQVYETQHSTSKVALNFAGSGALLQQIAKGAPVDVFASADQDTMDMAQQQGLVQAQERRNFARNSLVVVQALHPANSVKLEKLADLKQLQKIALSLPNSVPVGRYSQHALEKAGLWQELSGKFIYTQNVRQSLDYVARAEVDAGFVYATDAALMKDKLKLAFTVALDQDVSYPIAPVQASKQADEARRFVAFVLSAPAQAILAKYGFNKP